MYDNNYLNPPTKWHSQSLQTLHQRLIGYQGVDYFAHPYRQTHTTTIGAAVLVLFSHEAKPRLLLTKRSQHLSSHAGEISFVGGRRDDGDTSVAHTALREAQEEVCLDPKQVEIIGYLPCQTAKSGTLVRPVVGLIDPSISEHLIGGDTEIERILWAEFDYFLCNAPQESVIKDTKSALCFATPTWSIENEMVWGLTGRILANLLEIGFGQSHPWYYRPLTP